MKKSLDEMLDEEGLLLDYENEDEDGEGQGIIMPSMIEEDNIATCIEVEKNSAVLFGMISGFKKKVNRVAGDGLGSAANRAAHSIGRKITGRAETSLIDDYNAIIGLASDVHGSLGGLLAMYRNSFKSIETLYRKKSIELMDYVGMKGQFDRKSEMNGSLKLEIGKKISGLKPKNGYPTLDEIKYGDAMANLELRAGAVNTVLSTISSKIERSRDDKKRLFEERRYHEGLLNAYIEAYSLCGDLLEMFGVTTGLHISSTYMIRNARGLIENTEKMHELSGHMHLKTHEGLMYISQFNRKGKSMGNMGRGPASVSFDTRSYIKGLLN